MSITKELDRVAFDVSQEITDKLYKVIDYHLSHSDIQGIHGPHNYNDAHDYVMNQVINRLYKNE